MPSSETDIPHIAFTHHRIGRHDKPGPRPVVPEVHLSAIEVPEDMSPAEEQRNLGLALLEVADRGLGPATFREAAWQHLQGALSQGAEDGALLSAIARLAWERNAPQAEELAKRALADPLLPAGSRLNALIVTGDLRWSAADLDGALAAFRRLTEVRRHSEDWRSVASLQAEQGQMDQARKSWERAVAIQPFREDLRRMYADHLRRMGQDGPAKHQAAVADRLRDAFRPVPPRTTP
jgi:tetratricopeptide (TPR) repeat protein